MENPVKKTWMPVAGGIITLVAGVIGLLRGLALLALGNNIGGAVFDFPGFPLSSSPSVVLSLLAVHGGFNALKRKSWWWALAGAFCAFFGWRILAVPAVILVILSRKEFE